MPPSVGARPRWPGNPGRAVRAYDLVTNAGADGMQQKRLHHNHARALKSVATALALLYSKSQATRNTHKTAIPRR